MGKQRYLTGNNIYQVRVIGDGNILMSKGRKKKMREKDRIGKYRGLVGGKLVQRDDWKVD